MFIKALFTTAKTWKQQRKSPSTDQWIKKSGVPFSHTEYYSAMKKKEILPSSMTWMDLEDIMLSEISQTKKDKYCISLICGI